MRSSNENDKHWRNLFTELRENRLIAQQLVEAAKTVIELSKMLIAQSRSLCQTYHQIYAQTLISQEASSRSMRSKDTKLFYEVNTV